MYRENVEIPLKKIATTHIFEYHVFFLHVKLRNFLKEKSFVGILQIVNPHKVVHIPRVYVCWTGGRRSQLKDQQRSLVVVL
jgi:hypothetical protein